MNRNITYAGEQGSAKDTCNTNIYAMIGIAKVAEAILGENPLINNLECTQATVPNMTVYLEPGEIYSMQNVDNSNFGPIPLDVTHQILKTGVMIDRAIISLTAPSTPGDSIIYLIQIEFSEVDDQSESRPYSGGSPSPTLTRRADLLSYNVKAGVPSPTPVAPSPDSGFSPAYIVTVANGQTSILNSNIQVADSAPFITEKLSDKISQTTAETLFPLKSQLQSGALTYATTSGTNTYLTSLSPALAGYTDGMVIRIKFGATNTGASTLNVNGLGAINILRSDASAISGGEIVANSYRTLIYSGTSTAFLLQLSDDDFVSSISGSSNYMRLPDGVIYQWGKATLPNSGTTTSSVSVSFALPYTTLSSISVTTSFANAPNASNWGQMSTSAESLTTSGFTFTGDTGQSSDPNQKFANTVDVYWIAIGK